MLKTMENVSLVALAVAVGTAHHMIAPPTWLSILGVLMSFGIGMAHGEVWSRIRRARGAR